jgi:hypothetical protein
MELSDVISSHYGSLWHFFVDYELQCLKMAFSDVSRSGQSWIWDKIALIAAQYESAIPSHQEN